MNGLLLIDKPPGWSSHDVVAKVRRLLKVSSVGHTGTLDPFATGLMILLLGEATKLSQLITQKDKTYEVLLRLGIETDSLDRTGQILRESPLVATVSPDDIMKSLEEHLGVFEFAVPEFSAVKIKGRPMYRGAHRGEAQEAPLKEMSFYDLKVLQVDLPFVRVEISCSKGSYIRSWVREIGKSLNCGATAWELRRLVTPPYSLDSAMTLGVVEEQSLQGGGFEFGRSFIPLKSALPELLSLRATPWDEKLLRNGALSKDLVARLMPLEKEVHQKGESRIAKILSLEDGDLIALVEAQPQQGGFKVKRVFHRSI